jgi:hypothetical protein
MCESIVVVGAALSADVEAPTELGLILLDFAVVRQG